MMMLMARLLDASGPVSYRRYLIRAYWPRESAANFVSNRSETLSELFDTKLLR